MIAAGRPITPNAHRYSLQHSIGTQIGQEKFIFRPNAHRYSLHHIKRRREVRVVVFYGDGLSSPWMVGVCGVLSLCGFIVAIIKYVYTYIIYIYR
jgi:hypothetical protein